MNTFQCQEAVMESRLAQWNREGHAITPCWIQSLSPMTHILTKVQKKSKAPANNCIMHILTCGERIAINAQETEGEDSAFTQRCASPQLQPSTRARYCSIIKYVAGFHWGHWLCQGKPKHHLSNCRWRKFQSNQQLSSPPELPRGTILN